MSHADTEGIKSLLFCVMATISIVGVALLLRMSDIVKILIGIKDNK